MLFDENEILPAFIIVQNGKIILLVCWNIDIFVALAYKSEYMERDHGSSRLH